MKVGISTACLVPNGNQIGSANPVGKGLPDFEIFLIHTGKSSRIMWDI